MASFAVNPNVISAPAQMFDNCLINPTPEEFQQFQIDEFFIIRSMVSEYPITYWKKIDNDLCIRVDIYH